MVFTRVFMCVRGMRAARWQRSYIGVYFLFKAEAAQETTGADCHSAAPEMGNTQERHLALIWVSDI